LINSFLEESVAKILRSHEVMNEHFGPQMDAEGKKGRVTWESMSLGSGDMWSARKSRPDFLAPNRHLRDDAIFVDEYSSDELPSADATYESLRLAAEPETPTGLRQWMEI
jgi:hypothetical protein